MNTVVIGAGPAGMMAAITASQNGDNVKLLEKMNSIGKKLLITGKGRCNITNSADINEFIKNVPGNGMFLYSVFNRFTNLDLIEFFNQLGLETKEERGERIFPKTDRSVDVLEALKKKLKIEDVEIIANIKVKNILVDENKVIGVIAEKNQKEQKIFADKVIIATGGKSYPLTGSTGDGYELAKRLGHTIEEIKPSLIPLETYDSCVKDLQGLSLKNINIKLIDISNNKEIYNEFGEMLFTHFGVSGPVILSASAHLLRYKNLAELLKKEKIKLYIDLKPALSDEKLDLRIQRDFEKVKNKYFKNSLNELLPKKIIDVIIKKSEIDTKKQINQVTKQERLRLVQLLKNFDITIKGFRPIEEAIITSGGVNIKEINPSTMESKIIKGMFFAGEIIDVDAYTGGFNLQIAFSTGFVAGS